MAPEMMGDRAVESQGTTAEIRADSGHAQDADAAGMSEDQDADAAGMPEDDAVGMPEDDAVGMPEDDAVGMSEDLAALARALKHASHELSRVRARTRGADIHVLTESTEAANGILESIDTEAESLRVLLERRPLDGGCDPVREDAGEVSEPPAEREPLAGALELGDQETELSSGETQGVADLLTRLEDVDGEYDEVAAEYEAVIEELRTTDRPQPVARRAAAAGAPPRTFRAGMHGKDIRAWQRYANRRLRDWGIDYALEVDGKYGEATALWSKRILHGLGFSIADWDGRLTPQARIKARHPESRSPAELTAARARRTWLRKLRQRYSRGRVHTPVENISRSDWGYNPPVHDGIDLICPENAKLFAVCRAKVIDVRAGGWWGKGATPSPGHPVTDGDGIIQLRALDSIGPLKKGMHIGYGHAERARVRVGQDVKAGEIIGHAGYARTPHCHWMMNDGSTTRGIGNFNPRACLNLFTGRASR